MRSKVGFSFQTLWLALGLVIVASLGTWTSTVLAQRGREESGAKYGWLDNYQEAKALARKSGLPLMVVIRCIP